MKFEVVEVKRMPGDAKILALVTVKGTCAEGNKYYMRYKVVPGKNGGVFHQSPSIKLTENGVDSYVPAFTPDSSYENEEIKRLIHQALEMESQRSSSFAHSQTPQRPNFTQTTQMPPNPWQANQQPANSPHRQMAIGESVPF